MRHPVVIFALLAAVATAVPAFAHAKLIASSPAAQATVDKPGKIVLTFSEKVMPAFTGAELMMTSMAGMAGHDPMKISDFTTAMSADGKTLTLLMRRALASGSYQVNWHAGGADAHRLEGTFSFTVK